MKKLIWVFILMNIFYLSFPAVQDYYFKHINIESGLSQNTVMSIYQDSKGFMWFGTKNGLNRYDGAMFKIFNRETESNQLKNSMITAISEDREGNLWIGTDKGVSVYHPLSESFTIFDKCTPNHLFIQDFVRKIVIDKQNNIWILTISGLFKYNPYTDYLQLINNIFHSLTPHTPTCMSIDNDGVAWIGIASYGIIKMNIETEEFSSFLDQPANYLEIKDFKNNYLLVGTDKELLKVNKQNGFKKVLQLDAKKTNVYVRTIEKITDDEYWIGTETGIYIVKNEQVIHLIHDLYDTFSLSDNAVYSICKDREGGIWVGTYFGGVDFIPEYYSAFKKYTSFTNPRKIKGERIRDFCEDKEGNLWIATEDNGLNYFNLKENKITPITTGNEPFPISYHNIQSLHLHEDELWIGFFSKGIDVIHLKTKKRKHYEKSDISTGLDNDDIFSIYTDSTGKIWIGTSTGVLYYDRMEDRFVKLHEFDWNFISDILEDKFGNIWFATYNNGAIQYNPRSGQITNYSYDIENEKSICFYKITSIFKDHTENLWFCSEDGGFCSFDYQTETFNRITIRDGLPGNVTHKILEDENNDLWISTNAGLIRYNVENKKIRIFDRSNGLITNQFNYKSGIKIQNGELFFGSINGFIRFNPEDFKEDYFQPAIVLTGFQIFNKDVKPGLENSPLKKSVSYTEKIDLSYKESSFSFDFATLNYGIQQVKKYAYKLEGFDTDWIYTDSKQRIVYNNIHPGKYIFRIKAITDNNITQETSVQILIKPPFWKTLPAYLIYFIGGTVLLFGIVRYNLRKYKIRKRRREEILEQKRKEEIYNSQIEFFTNIAHEIRTPLSLIKAPLDYILNTKVTQEESHDNLVIMEKNVDRLLALVNQLLDFREVESKIFRLNFSKNEINRLVNDTYIRFESIARQKGLNILLDIPEESIYAFIDSEAFIKILSNLFNNAVKYAESYVAISVSRNREENSIEVRVNNDGKPIPAEYRDKIFEVFFQLKESRQKAGSGIGLALAKSLVDLHQGTIFLDDGKQDCISFVVRIPDGMNTEEMKKEESAYEENLYEEEMWSILIVEDNKELQNFLVDKLDKLYKVFYADNGLEAQKIMNEQIINLVISDIVMPYMDGFELTKAIKTNLDTSHIPVILLTAKTNMNSKIEGLKTGADAYIEKPFSIVHLLAQIENLFENREIQRNSFSNNPFIASNAMAQTKADEQFLNTISEIVLNNIQDYNFNIDHLAREMNMSRANLHRKLKGVAKMTPGDFIRVIRLKKAAELLSNGEYRIGEITFLVGFQSQSYFSKNFQKQFGILPKEFQKKVRKNNLNDE